MAGLFGLFNGSGDRATKPIYSIEHLQHLYNRLQHIKDDDQQNRDTTVEVIRQITEALIWGEQNGHDHNFFDFFCEKNILAYFVQVLGRPLVAKTVKVQLLQTLSMLVQNIRRDTSLYYLFSNNYVNQLISTQFDWNDEEILGYYISFVKSLSMRLNAETIKFFFNERAEQFPLYIEAIRFFGHRDVMVRAAVRSLTLQVYSIQDPAMQKFVLERSSCTYFVHLTCHLRELWSRLDAATRAATLAGSSESNTTQLHQVNEEQQDLLMYLSDVLELDVPALSAALAHRLLHSAFLPVLLGSLVGPPASDSGRGSRPDAASAGPGETAHRISPVCALFVLHQIFDAFRSRSLLEPLASALLMYAVPLQYQNCCRSPPPAPPPTYQATSSEVSGPASVEATAAGASAAAAALAEADSRASEPDPDSPGGVRVTVRSRFLGYLEDECDACPLLVSGILRCCLAARSKALPQALLEETAILPYSHGRKKTHELLGCLLATAEGGGSAGQVGVESAYEERHAGPQPPPDQHPLDVLLRAVRSLERHQELRVVAVMVLARFARDVVTDPIVRDFSNSSDAAARGDAGTSARLLALPLLAARSAAASAARQVRSYLNSEFADAFLDIFAEEWELHCGPTLDVKDACNSVRCLMPPSVTGTAGAPAEWTFPSPRSERQHAAKATRCLLIIRWLHADLLEGDGATASAATTSSAAVAGYPEERDSTVAVDSADDVSQPLHIAGEVVDGYQEGRPFELGRQDRIVCGVVTPEGRHTRYLVLHQFLFLLVQPDVESPGLACVRTLAPVSHVESQIDPADPRTLRLTIRLVRGAPCPGEASVYDPASADPGFRLPAEEHRGSAFFTLTLSFEDVKRCHHADRHLRSRRQEVRAQLRSRVEAFIDYLC